MRVKKPSKENLDRLYNADKYSLSDIAKMYGVHRQTISNWMKSYNLSVRTFQEGCATPKAIKKNHDNNINKYMLQDTKNKISKTMSEKWQNDNELKLRYSIERSGKNNPNYGKGLFGKNNGNWKGGISTKNHNFRTSTKYKEWRISVFERDNYTCQECKNIGGNLNVHHILPFRDWNDTQFSLNIKNGITLCHDCHIKTFGNEYEYFNKYFDIVNNIGR